MSALLIFKLVFLASQVIEIIIRAPFGRMHRRNRILLDLAGRQQTVLLLGFTLGSFILPLVYIFTPWLGFADYRLPDWAGWLGVALMAGAVGVFWRAHVDLGQNWSPALQIRAGHTLVTNGIFRYVRHPMYASQWLAVIAQALLLQNWLPGVGGLILFAPMYFVRMPQEEQMLLAQFGDAYRAYMARTGRVLPRRPARP